MVLSEGKHERTLLLQSWIRSPTTPPLPPVCTVSQQTEDGKTEIHLGKMEIFSDNLQHNCMLSNSWNRYDLFGRFAKQPQLFISMLFFVLSSIWASSRFTSFVITGIQLAYFSVFSQLQNWGWYNALLAGVPNVLRISTVLLYVPPPSHAIHQPSYEAYIPPGSKFVWLILLPS